MVVREEDAKKFYCCSDPAAHCKGNKCMGWKTHFITGKRDPNLIPPKSLEPAPMVATDRGHCGFVK